VPFIAWGPGLVKPQAGAERALGDITDILPTLAELAEVPLPNDRVFDGQSLAALLGGKTTTHRPWIYSHLDDGRVLRNERWLLEIPGKGQPARFFDCGQDRSGQAYKLVSASEPEEARSAREQFQQILEAFPEPRARDTSAD